MSLLAGQDCLIHLAGVAHNPKATHKDYQVGNVELTANLTKAAKDAGMQHIIMLSSLKAMGERTKQGQPLTHNAPCQPEDNYGRSKLEAEITLKKLCNQLKIRWTLIRPPLVYSQNAGGNIAKLKKAINKGWPIPVAGIPNQRSIVSLPVLCDLIATCVDNPAANNETFLVSDGETITTEQLVRKLADEMGKTANLKTLPSSAYSLAKRLPGTKSLYQKLLGDLAVDIEYTCSTLDWSPKMDMELAAK